MSSTAIKRKAETMLCTYCAVRKPWDRQHFPDRMAAVCVDCFPSDDVKGVQR